MSGKPANLQWRIRLVRTRKGAVKEVYYYGIRLAAAPATSHNHTIIKALKRRLT